MFIGHFGVGFAAKGVAKNVSLGSLFLAAQLIDLLWPTLLLLGVESVTIEPGITAVTPLNFEHYPISHSLLLVIVWAAAFSLLYWLFTKRRRGALVLGALVISHWVLDLLVHRPDLPLYPGSSIRAGFGLWSSRPATLAVELPIYAIGVWMYAQATTPIDRRGTWGLWLLTGILLILYALNLLGPAPPNVASIAWTGQLQWLFIIWAYRIDRHRRPVNDRH